MFRKINTIHYIYLHTYILLDEKCSIHEILMQNKYCALVSDEHTDTTPEIGLTPQLALYAIVCSREGGGSLPERRLGGINKDND